MESPLASHGTGTSHLILTATCWAAGTVPVLLEVSGGAKVGAPDRRLWGARLSPKASLRNGSHHHHHCSKATRA